MKPTLDDVMDTYPGCEDYIDNMDSFYRGNFVRFKEDYDLNSEAIEKLKGLVDDYVFVVMFADWCGDARRTVPILALLEDELNIQIRALGGMTKPMGRSEKDWAIPPSPAEVDTFEVTSSPTIIIFDKKTREEIGRMKTRPKMTPTVEEEILKIIENAR